MTDVGTHPAMHEEELLALYDRTIRDVHRYASRLAGGDGVRTDDLVQETYLHLLDQVRQGRVVLSDVGIGWLIVACRRRFLDDLRSSKRRAAREERVVALDRRAPVASPAGEIGADGRLDATDALGRMLPEHRAALVLRYVDDLPVREVAQALGRSVRATESLLVRARSAFQAATNPTNPTNRTNSDTDPGAAS